MNDNNINDLIEKAKANSNIETIQKVVPIKKKVVDEVQFSFYLNKKVLKKIKLLALNENESIKSIIGKALENYIEKNKKMTNL
mgnify:FL=1